MCHGMIIFSKINHKIFSPCKYLARFQISFNIYISIHWGKYWFLPCDIHLQFQTFSKNTIGNKIILEKNNFMQNLDEISTIHVIKMITSFWCETTKISDGQPRTSIFLTGWRLYSRPQVLFTTFSTFPESRV